MHCLISFTSSSSISSNTHINYLLKLKSTSSCNCSSPGQHWQHNWWSCSIKSIFINFIKNFLHDLHLVHFSEWRLLQAGHTTDFAKLENLKTIFVMILSSQVRWEGKSGGFCPQTYFSGWNILLGSFLVVLQKAHNSAVWFTLHYISSKHNLDQTKESIK